MMNIDSARVSDPVVGMSNKDDGITILDPKKPKDNQDSPGPTEPVFQGEERKLNIEIPKGWKVCGS